MNQNLFTQNIDTALPKLCHSVMTSGDAQGSRNGDTRELTFVGVALHAPWQREITIPDRKANLAAQIAETMWVLSGRDDVGFLSHYLPRAADFSDDKMIWRGGYGKRLRAWKGLTENDGLDWTQIDQLGFVVNLLKEDPLTRRAVMTIYDPIIDSRPGLDIPCNNWLHFLGRGRKLDLHVAIRSNDLIWGWSGINQFEWSVLLELIAALTGYEMGSLHFSISSLHIYKPHWEKALKISHALPAWQGLADSPRLGVKTVQEFDLYAQDWFSIEEKIRTGQDYGDSVINFRDPLLRSWLRVLEWWWTGDNARLEPLSGTRLSKAAHMALQPPDRTPPAPPAPSFGDFIIDLHAEKHKAYGDSWRRRGEMLGIMANIARKIDRLGVAGAGDTAADTAIDLYVYLVKYHRWLQRDGEIGQISLAGELALVTQDLARNEEKFNKSRQFLWDPQNMIDSLKGAFDELEVLVTEKSDDRLSFVSMMIPIARSLAVQLWEAEQRD